jgi:hypothetical protein
MPTLFLDRRTVKARIRMADVINVVDEAVGMCAESKGEVLAITYLFEYGDFRAMTATLPRRVSGKMVNVRSREPISCFNFDPGSGANL